MTLLATFLLPIVTSLFSIFIKGRFLTGINIVSSFLLLATSLQLLLEVTTGGAISITFGNWPIPYGIEFYADGLSAMLITLIALVSAVVMVFMSHWQKLAHEPAYFALTQVLVASAVAICLAADLFNLYVWFELMLIAVLGLLVLGKGPRHTEAALKYFAVSMIGTLIMLAAIGMIHGSMGHLNFSALSEITRSEITRSELAAASPGGNRFALYTGMLLLALLLKIGAFPLFAWLPAAYHALPAPLLALVGGLLTKISVYVFMRLDGQVFDYQDYHQALGWLAVMTMLSGVLGAAFHWDLRRILAFHIISQVGFLLLGIALSTPAGMTGTAFFLFHNMLVKANLFLIAGLVWMSSGHYDLRKIGGLYPARPLLAVIFLVSALSLVGVPPSSGFWGKLFIIMEAFNTERYLWASAALITGMLTLYSMSKIWLEGFWKPHPGQAINMAIPTSIYAVMILLTLVILVMGLVPDIFIEPLQQLQWPHRSAL